jgi:hypothetical protein
MSKIDKNNLAFLGFEFQLKFVLQLIIDKKFADDILDIVNPNF